MVIHKCPQEPRIASLFTLLHLHFGWSQKGPIFLLFLPFCICLKVPPAVHTSIPTFLDMMISRKTVKSSNENTAIISCQYPNRKRLCKKNNVGRGEGFKLKAPKPTMLPQGNCQFSHKHFKGQGKLIQYWELSRAL